VRALDDVSLIVGKGRFLAVAGPSGSGKSTTLAAMLNHLNQTERRNVVTIEDPIEFLFSNNKCIIQQRDLGNDARSFHSALVNALRHDLDVIVIAELRDLPTVSTAITAAETGHLVLGTMHTIDAAQSIDRMIDIFPAEQQMQIKSQLSQVLEAVLSQTLLSRIGGGRIAAFEIMIATNGIKKLIREGKIHEINSNLEHGAAEGKQTMEQALADMIKSNIVTKQEALAESYNPKKLLELLQ
jgi:twitching motility protein PilT